MKSEKFNDIISSAFRAYWATPAFTNYDSAETFSYADFAKRVAKIHILLENAKVKRGDKIALIGKDSTEWCMVWIAVATYGAVVVPILPDFHQDDILNIINHSDSVLVFAGTTHLPLLQIENLPNVRAVFGVKAVEVVPELTRDESLLGIDLENLFQARYPAGYTVDDIKYPEDLSNEDTMLINYTSGTTGFSKGVILSANNVVANLVYAISMQVLGPGDTTLSFLPNAHAFGCAFSFLLPLSTGAHTFILGVPPTPTALVKALKQVKPRLLLSVPLVFEKIYKNVILPQLQSGNAKIISAIPLVNRLVYRKIYDSLMETMGGKLEQVIIGGAAMNPEIAEFYSKVGFPYTIGYGLTECAPLVSYTYYKQYKSGSVGRYVDSMCEVRIVPNEDGQDASVGEIQVRGDNVCRGYYKDAVSTGDLFTADGWMHTGDLGTLDEDGTLYIRGRKKTMLLSSNGQNIYPEELEQKIDLQDHILESVVVQRGDQRLVAVVYLDYASLKSAGITEEAQVTQFLEETRKKVNALLPVYAQLHHFETRLEPFEKTPKQSIKRYLVE